MKQKQDIATYEIEWVQYPLDDYPLPCPYFDNIRMVQHLVGKEFIPNVAIEDQWINCGDDYEFQSKNYCRISLPLVERALT